MSAWAYSPSSNVSGNCGRVYGSAGIEITAENVWQILTGTRTATNIYHPYYGSVRNNGSPCTIGDIVYFDSFTYYRQNTLYLLNPGLWSSPDATIVQNFPNPATGVVPKGFVVRLVDALNYWYVQVRPNTAGNDVFVYEVIAGVETSRGTPVHVGWTAGQTDQIRVTLRTAAITVEKMLFGQSAWTSVMNYATMATGLSSSQIALMPFNTGVGFLDRIQISA
jgi:hypothetical protein